MTDINLFLKTETTLKLSNDTNCLITAPSFIHPTIGDSLSNLSNFLDPEVFDHRQRIFRRSPVNNFYKYYSNITQVIFNCILINNTKTYIPIEIKI